MTMLVGWQQRHTAEKSYFNIFQKITVREQSNLTTEVN